MENETELTPGAALFSELGQQITVLGLTLGCALKATAIEDPERADAIMENLKLLMSAQDVQSYQPRAKALLDLMYTALQEQPSHG